MPPVQQTLQVVLGQGRLEAQAARLGGEADFRDVDEGFDRLALAEEQPPRPVAPRPVVQQLAGDGRRAGVLAVLAPAAQVAAEEVDERQVFGGGAVRLLLCRGPGSQYTSKPL
jgi:hypothetical protein